MNELPWLVYTSIDFNYRIVARFGTRGEAEMHKQSLNQFSRTRPYKVRLENSPVSEML